MIRRWRWDRPLKTIRTFPNLRGRFLTDSHVLDDVVDKHQLREAKDKGTDRRHAIEVRKLQGIVWNPTWHTCQADEMHWEERDVHTNEG